jgi:hypothetical protein
MQIRTIIESNGLTISDNGNIKNRIRLLDITLTDGIISYGEIRIDNADGIYSNKFTPKSMIKISTGVVATANEKPPVFLDGFIDSVEEGGLLIIQVLGKGQALKEKRLKRSLHAVDSGKAFSDILRNTGLSYSLGKLPKADLHSWVMPDATLAEHLQRAAIILFPGSVVFVDRNGKLTIDLPENMQKETGITFEIDEFKRLENGTLDTIVDAEINPYDILTVAGVKYIVTNHRILQDGYKNRSLIALDAI